VLQCCSTGGGLRCRQYARVGTNTIHCNTLQHTATHCKTFSIFMKYLRAYIACTLARKHTHHTPAHTLTQPHTHTHTHTRTHKHTNTHTHTHTHSLSLSLSLAHTHTHAHTHAFCWYTWHTLRNKYMNKSKLECMYLLLCFPLFVADDSCPCCR